MSAETPAAGGFLKLAEEEIWRGRIVRVCRTIWAAPDGMEIERDVIRHPGAVAVVALTSDEPERVLMLRQFRASVGTEILEIPAGTLDVDGEDPLEAASRELEEEAGVRPGRIELLGEMLNSPGVSDQRTRIYLARELVASGARPAGVEERHMEVVALTWDEVGEAIADGSLVDAQSQIGLMLAMAVLGRQRRGTQERQDDAAHEREDDAAHEREDDAAHEREDDAAP